MRKPLSHCKLPTKHSSHLGQVGSLNTKSSLDILVIVPRVGLGPKVSVELFVKRRKVTGLLDSLPGKEMTPH